MTKGTENVEPENSDRKASGQRKAKRILSYDAYEATLLDSHIAGRGIPDEPADRTARLQKMFEIAMEMRNFEIELYWKRSTYYWAFMAATFAAIWTVAKEPALSFLTPLLSGLGFIFALGWYLATKGSKYWQKNWEDHLYALGVLSDIPIHSVTLTPKKYNAYHPLREYPFSVSKINQMMSFFVAIFWALILAWSVAGQFVSKETGGNAFSVSLARIPTIAGLILILVVAPYFLLSSALKSGVAKNEVTPISLCDLIKNTPKSVCRSLRATQKAVKEAFSTSDSHNSAADPSALDFTVDKM